VRVFGEPLEGINSRAGYLFQADGLMPWRNALENISAGLQFRGVARDEGAGDALQRKRRSAHLYLLFAFFANSLV
jgi:NitT/TauT family transport system ATP-binding protein